MAANVRGRMNFWAYLRAAACGAWNEFTANPRLYALFAAGPATLGVIVWLTGVVADHRWEQPVEQLDILKMAVMIMAFTHMIVVVALAAVRVAGRGPGGFSFDIDSDEHEAPKPVHMEGEVTLTATDPTPEAPPTESKPPWERKP